MAILWTRCVDGVRYEVRSAGRTRRLYTNGVCHSEFNPAKIVTGSVWDLLFIPAYFAARGEIRRILVLGVGGGATLLQLRHLLKPRRIIGVDSDPVHLDIAARFFGADRDRITLKHADARAWLDRYSGRPFDLIIEDLFVDEGREPVRPVQVDHGWAKLLLRHLSARGLLVVNFGSSAELRGSALVSDKRLASGFGSIFRLTTINLDNAVGAFLRCPGTSAALRSNLRSEPLLSRALLNRSLRYRILSIR